MLICLLAVVAGSLLPLLVPLVQFALGLTVVTVIAASLALGLGAPVGHVALWTAALFACAQVGYALGMAAIAAVLGRRQIAKGSRPSLIRSQHEPLLK